MNLDSPLCFYHQINVAFSETRIRNVRSMQCWNLCRRLHVAPESYITQTPDLGMWQGSFFNFSALLMRISRVMFQILLLFIHSCSYFRRKWYVICDKFKKTTQIIGIVRSFYCINVILLCVPVLMRCNGNFSYSMNCSSIAWNYVLLQYRMRVMEFSRQFQLVQM